MFGQENRRGDGGGDILRIRVLLNCVVATRVLQLEKMLRRAATPSSMRLETVRPDARWNKCRAVSLVTKDAGAAVKVTHEWSDPQALDRIWRNPDGNVAVVLA